MINALHCLLAECVLLFFSFQIYHISNVALTLKGLKTDENQTGFERPVQSCSVHMLAVQMSVGILQTE